MNDTVLDILKGHFGRNKEILPETNMLNDLGGDELDVVDIIMQIEEQLNICQWFINISKYYWAISI